MFFRILMPVAFSDRCRGAAQYAEALASHFHSELVLFHVVTPVPAYSFQDGMPLPDDVIGELLTHGRTQLAKFAAECLPGVPVRQVVLEGDPALQIVDYTNAGGFDLIVMPTHGYGPFRRFLLGSVTAKVLHDARCPVWTGPHLEGAPAYASIGFRKILCAIDLGIDSRAILQWGAGFAREYGAGLAVTYAIAEAAAEKEARERIALLEEESGVQGEIVIRTGDVPAAVRAATEDIGADLLVIGRGRGDEMLGRLRTNAYAILREAACPVAAI